MGGDSHQDLNLRHRSAQRPQMVASLMAEQLAPCSPLAWGKLPSRGPGPAQRGDVKNPNPDRKHTLARAPHPHTRLGD